MVSRIQRAEHAVGSPSRAGDVAHRLCGEFLGTNGFDADAVAVIVDEAKQHGLIDEALTTSSIVFFCHTLGLGAHTMESVRPNWGGRGIDAWNALMEHILAALRPDGPLTPESTA